MGECPSSHLIALDLQSADRTHCFWRLRLRRRQLLRDFDSTDRAPTGLISKYFTQTNVNSVRAHLTEYVLGGT